MTEGELQLDNRTVEQIVDDMDLFDDDLMSMVFDNNIPATELLLKIILKQDDITVINVAGQREFQNPIVGGRNIRRARFNSSMMDSRMLKEGQEFSELQDSYMVFITQKDVFGHGIPVYTINRHFEEIDDLFDDGSHIVYVNGSYKGDDAVGKLMHDFSCKNSKDIYYLELAKSVKHFKEEEGGRKAMCEAVEKYAERKAETVRVDNLLEIVKNLMESMKWTSEQAMVAMQISDKDKSILLKKL